MRTINEITYQDTPIGPRWSYGTVGFISPDEAAGFGRNELRSALTGLQAVHNAAAKRLQPDHVAEHVREQSWGGVVRGATRDSFNAALAEAREAREADLRHMEPARPVEAELARDTWAAYRSMDRAARARAIEFADLSELTALHQYGNRVPLAPEEADLALPRYRLENRLAKDNVAARHPAVATVDDPLVIGPDMDAARAEVETWEKAHAKRLETVKANEATAQHLIGFLATVFDVPPQEVLDTALGRENANA